MSTVRNTTPDATELKAHNVKVDRIVMKMKSILKAFDHLEILNIFDSGVGYTQYEIGEYNKLGKIVFMTFSEPMEACTNSKKYHNTSFCDASVSIPFFADADDKITDETELNVLFRMLSEAMDTVNDTEISLHDQMMLKIMECEELERKEAEAFEELLKNSTFTLKVYDGFGFSAQNLCNFVAGNFKQSLSLYNKLAKLNGWKKLKRSDLEKDTDFCGKEFHGFRSESAMGNVYFILND